MKSWIKSQLTWKNCLQVVGLVALVVYIFSHDHPDPTTMFVLGSLAGAPTFVQLLKSEKEKGDK